MAGEELYQLKISQEHINQYKLGLKLSNHFLEFDAMPGPDTIVKCDYVAVFHNKTCNPIKNVLIVWTGWLPKFEKTLLNKHALHNTFSLRCRFNRSDLLIVLPSKTKQVLDYFLQHMYSRKLQKYYLLKKF
jgi:hypothetical protein